MKESTDNAENPYLIVIGREYGSGGKEIGQYIARALDVPFYDKTLLSKAAERLGYSTEIFERKDERRPSLLRSLLSFNYGAANGDPSASMMSDENLYEFQSRVIKELCAKGSCVIVGRTADYVMRDHPRMLSLFIHAPMPERVKRIMQREEISSEKEAADLAAKKDRMRESYYNYYTNREWGKCRNYHLSVDSSVVSREALLKMVCGILGIPSGER